MDHEIKNRIILLRLDGSRLIGIGILQQKHHDIDELLADNLIHTKVGDLRDSGTISDDNFHLLFPPTDLRKWDETITSHFLKHCTNLEQPKLTILDELHELRNKAMELYQNQEMSNEEYTSEWERTVNTLERGKTLLDGPIVGEIDETINRIKQTPITPEDMNRINSWYYLEAKSSYEDTETGYGNTAEGKSVVHEAAYHGKLSTLQYMRNKFPDRLLELDKDGNQAIHFAAGGGHIECLRYIFESFPDLQMARNENEMDALHCAACDGSLECLTYLISQGMNIDTRTKEGDTLLHLSAYGGSLSMLQYIYETYPKLKNKRNEKGQDALYRGVRGGNLDCLKYLIDQGMNPDTRSKYGNTLLHAAAYGGIVSIVKYILETFPKMKNETDEKGMDALFSAACGESLDCLIYLIGQGLTMDTRSKYGSTILHSAAFVRSIPIVQYICETFPYLIKERNKKGQDALHIAVRGGSIDCLEYLIGQGLTPDTRSKTGDTLLHAAVYGGSVPMVQYVCETFPDLIKERNEKGQDALHSATLGGSIACFKYLIGQGLTPDTRSKTGNTLLHTAVYGGSVRMVQYVWETFPQLQNERNQHGKDATFSAVHGDSLDCLKYLINHGMNTDTRSNKGRTLFEEAAYDGIFPMVQYLFETFTDWINGENQKGTNALLSAVRGGSLVCVKYLISQGMNTNTQTKEGDTLLHLAACGGSLSMVQYVYKTCRELKNKRNEKGQDALYRAACGGSLDCLKYLINRGMNTDTRSKHGHTLLHAAAHGGNVSMVKYIIETFSMKYETDEKGMDALFSAVLGESLDCLTYLISQGLNTATRSMDGNTLLHTAANGGSVPIVQYLCESFPDLIKERNKKGQDALHSATLGGDLDCLKYLIGQGMTPDTRSKTGNTLLHTAVYGGSVRMVQYVWETFPQLQNERNQQGKDATFSAVHGDTLDCLKYLINHGMNTDTRSNKGRTLFEEAAYNGIVPMVQYLFETFTDWINGENQEGTNALLSAVRGGNIVCVKYLISQGINTNTRTKYGETLLHVAAFAGSLSIVQYICETFPEMKHEINTKGECSLHSATRGGSLDCLIYLIDQGMTIYLWSKNEETILHQAAFHGHEGLVRYICENHFKLINYKQTHGRTATFSAVNGGHLDILKYLLSHIDPTQTDNRGQTILHAAAWKGKPDVVRYLCTTFKFLISIHGYKGEAAIGLAQRNGHLDCIKIIQEPL